MQRAASRRITTPSAVTLVSRADAVPGEAAQGLVNGCGWHGMQEVTALEADPGLLLPTAARSCRDWLSCRFLEAHC
jgi:hypothetical protein